MGLQSWTWLSTFHFIITKAMESKSKNSFPHGVRIGFFLQPNQSTQVVSVWWEPPSCFADGPLLTVSLHSREGMQTISHLFLWGHLSHHKGPSFKTSSSPKGPPLNTITLQFRVSIRKFGGDTNVQSIAVIMTNIWLWSHIIICILRHVAKSPSMQLTLYNLHVGDESLHFRRELPTWTVILSQISIHPSILSI